MAAANTPGPGAAGAVADHHKVEITGRVLYGKIGPWRAAVYLAYHKCRGVLRCLLIGTR